MRKKAEIVLKFIPASRSIDYSFLKELLGKWAPDIDPELDAIITKLLDEGVIFEPQPACYQAVKTMEVGKMETVSDIYRSAGNFLNAKVVRANGLIGRKLTIKSINRETIGQQSPKEKLVIDFDEITERLVLNATNAKILAETWGEAYNRWVSKQLLMQITKRTFQGVLVDAIEVVPQ